MTRKEAKKLFREDTNSYGKPKSIMSKIDKIYDDFESTFKKILEHKFDIDANFIYDDNGNLIDVNIDEKYIPVSYIEGIFEELK